MIGYLVILYNIQKTLSYKTHGKFLISCIWYIQGYVT